MRWTMSVAAAAAACALFGAGLAIAKNHGQDGPGDHGKHGGPGIHGGPHGGPHAGPHDGGGKRKGRSDCAEASSTIGAFVDVACPCAGADDGSGGTVAWRNHGQYVRCVAHAVRDAARSLGVKKRCGRGLVRCAARSACGKHGGAVACIVPTGGTCLAGACTEDAALPCTSDADCAASECRAISADECAALGGSEGSGSCCTASPDGAFVD